METTLDNIEKSRNTQAQLSWYETRSQAIDGLPVAPHRLVDMMPVFSTRQAVTRFLETYDYWNLIRDIPGNIIECGVAGGNFLMAMAHFASIFEPHHYTRRVVGFDTFEGFTEPTKEDLSSAARHMHKGGLAFESFDMLTSAIELFDGNRMIGHVPKVELVKGDICETFPAYLERCPAATIGLLHLDLDLYKPTRDVLDLAWDRMARGAVVVFDEINHEDYPGETIAVRESLGLDRLRLRRVPCASMAAYCIKGE
ncbi:TylF/MycF/NovP-related O-methyltransferase [Stappia sp. ES.058]|uniref:TylF/MycF/NovP-related O-methyltransferase n=1 Tax=Stappia sp. ES.058 TaxID=1881061 RepID=UPI0012FE0799|nr:TylF/MycF/NovP-related O-methyltransferase [Stappia sp. ES.058]